MTSALLSRGGLAEILRYGINGLVATAVHYTALRLQLDGLGVPSAGVANFVAALFGIATSFVGSRYFVFQNTREPWLRQFLPFVLLYGLIAVMHGLILYVWTDRLGLDLNLGFVLAIIFQVAGSYVGNKYVVFKG